MATDIIARGMITEYKSGANINFAENEDGSVTISASGSISSEDSVARDAIGNHKSDTSNPHNVTPAQIGLGNVDNTSDLDKPISTAVQKAIDNKADKTVATTTADGLMSAVDKTKLDGANDTYALKSKYGDTTINVGRKTGSNVGEYSTAEGINTTASGSRSHAEGSATNALGSNSHSEGRFTTAFGDGSHSEGESIYTIGSSIPNYLSELSTMTDDEIISAWNDIAFSLAKGLNSHSEGYNTLALGNESHAGGSSTIAKGRNSYSGGGNSLAEGSNSFTHGYYTKSSNAYESSFGKCNQSNTDTLFSIGDGTSDSARHNAFEITTTGGKLHDKDIATTDIIPDLSEYAKTADVPNIKVNEAVNADTVGGHSVGCDVPADAKFTDTIPDLSPYAKKADVPNIKVNAAVNADTVDNKHASDFAAAINPTIDGEVRLIRTGNNTTVPMIFAWEETFRIRNIEDESAENRTYTDLIVTPDGIYTESLINGVIRGRTKIESGKPYITGSATVAANSSVCVSNHGFTPCAVVWWDGNSSGVAVSFNETQFNINIISTDARTVNYLIFK